MQVHKEKKYLKKTATTTTTIQQQGSVNIPLSDFSQKMILGNVIVFLKNRWTAFQKTKGHIMLMSSQSASNMSNVPGQNKETAQINSLKKDAWK